MLQCKLIKTINSILKTIKNYDHVTPFLKITNSSVSNCSLGDGIDRFH